MLIKINEDVTIEIFYFSANQIENNDIKSLLFAEGQNPSPELYAYYISNPQATSRKNIKQYKLQNHLSVGENKFTLIINDSYLEFRT